MDCVQGDARHRLYSASWERRLPAGILEASIISAGWKPALPGGAPDRRYRAALMVGAPGTTRGGSDRLAEASWCIDLAYGMPFRMH